MLGRREGPPKHERPEGTHAATLALLLEGDRHFRNALAPRKSLLHLANDLGIVDFAKEPLGCDVGFFARSLPLHLTRAERHESHALLLRRLRLHREQREARDARDKRG